MIQVDKLVKSYGPAQALRGISFEVSRGEVIGFLGPNGAGKSTTMKILTGFLLPTGGRATIQGMDVVEQSLEVRRRIGYLPESTPLYTEMRVDDYLSFAARIRGVRRNVARAVSRVVELCGLQRVTGKNIIELSKGYKQRVGLAQAMIHEPDLLILDEPTSGLDPNQIIEVRSLVRRLAEEHTVILSTHYLQEVEAVASRIIIVNLGEIVADDTKDSLVSGRTSGDLFLRVVGPDDKVRAQIGELLPGREIELLEQEGDARRYRLDVGETTSGHIEDAVAQLIVKNKWSLLELSRRPATLEDVFCELTVSDRLEVNHA